MTWQVLWCLAPGLANCLHSHARLFRTMTHALASFASLRVAPAVGTTRRVGPAVPKRGLVIAAGKKGAWEGVRFRKPNAVVSAEVDVNKWPGLARYHQMKPFLLSFLIKLLFVIPNLRGEFRVSRFRLARGRAYFSPVLLLPSFLARDDPVQVRF